MKKVEDASETEIFVKPHPATGAWLSVVRAYNICSKAIANQVSGTGLNLLQHEILLNLLHEPGLSQQQLAMKCFSAKSGISAVVSNLEKCGFLVRRSDENDFRKKSLFLTEQGLEQAQVNLALQNEIVETMANAYTTEGLNSVEEGMNQSSALLKEKFL